MEIVIILAVITAVYFLFLRKKPKKEVIKEETNLVFTYS